MLLFHQYIIQKGLSEKVEGLADFWIVPVTLLKPLSAAEKPFLIPNHREHASTARGIISPASGFKAESGILILEQKSSLSF